MKLNLKDPWISIGNTKLIRISEGLYAKLETENPTGSIKDRPIQYIVNKAIQDGDIDANTVFVEASSGNTGISLSAIGASLGLEVKIIMPSNMSEERRQMMRIFGADIIDSPPSDFKGAIQLRNKLVNSNQCFWSPMQFENPLNIQCHYETTASEIIRQVSGTPISGFFSGAGTGGTMMGMHQRVRQDSPHTKCFLVAPAEPSECHGIQGIGDGGDYLVNKAALDGVSLIKTSRAIERAKEFAKSTGLLVGISAGANLCAAEDFIKKAKPAGIVVTILCDRGERYLSIY